MRCTVRPPVILSRLGTLSRFLSLLARTVGPNIKNPPKNKIEKFVKFTDHNCACKDLTNFECEGQTMTGDGSSVKKICF